QAMQFCRGFLIGRENVEESFRAQLHEVSFGPHLCALHPLLRFTRFRCCKVVNFLSRSESDVQQTWLQFTLPCPSSHEAVVGHQIGFFVKRIYRLHPAAGRKWEAHDGDRQCEQPQPSESVANRSTSELADLRREDRKSVV